MAHLRLIVGAQLRDELRWAREHLYSLLILSPLVLVLTYVGVGRLVRDNAVWQLSPPENAALASVVVACLVALGLSRVSGELYHSRSPESFLDTLPIAPDTHLFAALCRRITRTAAVAFVALVGRTIFEGGPLADASLIPLLALFIMLTALAEVLAALEWIHWGHRRSRAHAGASLLALLPGAALSGLLLLLIVKPAWLAGWNVLLIDAAALVWIALLFALVLSLHRLWRSSDIEYAKRLRAGRRFSAGGERVARILRAGQAVAAQIARDLQLTLRAFSSGVYVAGATVVLLLSVLVAILRTGLLPSGEPPPGLFEATWLPSVMAVKVVTVFLCVSLTSLVPLLVAHQIPHLWLERVAGTTGTQLWSAKLWYARLVSSPAPLLAWAVGFATGEVPLYYALPLLGECVWLWWLASTLVGALSFEMPHQPGLAIILMACLTLAVCLTVAVLWPMGLALYAFGMGQLLMRGQQRAHYHLVKEEG
ncbi:MAG TPA: hypothetical protein VM934_09360 [Pyrinomonadaceae bacterium]|nr:hypothetical protein [Pyrinomonadaceae bacterium]